VWEPEDFMRLVALSQLHPVVCGVYPAKREQTTFYLYRDEQAVLLANEQGLLEVWGMGLGFTVTRREVIESLVAKAPRVWDDAGDRELAEVFRIGGVDDKGRRRRRGEDIAFFADIRAAGYKVLLDPEVSLGHVGTKVYTGSVKDALKVSP